MTPDQELTAEQFCDAYRSGQRKFEKIDLVGGDTYPTVSDIDLHDCSFVECWFDSATFINVNFNRAEFVSCNLKCATFKNCDLRDSVWRDCTVCSVAIGNCATGGLKADGLEAYGARIHEASVFLEYAVNIIERYEATKRPSHD